MLKSPENVIIHLQIKFFKLSEKFLHAWMISINNSITFPTRKSFPIFYLFLWWENGKSRCNSTLPFMNNWKIADCKMLKIRWISLLVENLMMLVTFWWTNFVITLAWKFINLRLWAQVPIFWNAVFLDADLSLLTMSWIRAW